VNGTEGPPGSLFASVSACFARPRWPARFGLRRLG
jgi:hypothetical protein